MRLRASESTPYLTICVGHIPDLALIPIGRQLTVSSGAGCGTVVAALDRDGCAIIFEEKRKGTKRNDREQLEHALKVLTNGDTLVVTRLDRLGRSMRDLANIVHEIEEVGAHLRVIEQSVDTGTSAGRAFFGMLAVFAQFETDVRRDRQAEGIARAKKAGVYTGGKQRIDRQKVLELAEVGNGPAAIARDLGISRMSVYRILREEATSPVG